MGAISANDFLFEIDETTPGTPDTEIAEVIDFDIQGGEVTQQDFSTLKGKRAKSQPGKLSQAMLVLNARTDMSDPGQSACRAAAATGATKSIKVTAPTGETWAMSGYFTNEPGANGSIDNSVNTTFNLLIDGDIATDDGGA